MMRKVTWIIHGIIGTPRMTYHTHGLCEYGSLELELNLPLRKEQATQFINLVGLTIAGGKRYCSGDMETDIFTLPFYLFKTVPIHGSGSAKERVLRIIFPDPNVRYPWDEGCEKDYRNQMSEQEISAMRHILFTRKTHLQ